jgi:thiamine biosynthesis lipoprotein
MASTARPSAVCCASSAGTCMLADTRATALLVLGESAGPQLAQEFGLHALFVLRECDGLREILLVDGQLQT